MCGIYAALSASPAHQPSPELQQCLCNRGPDHVGTVQSRIAGVTSSAGDVYLTCTATVLSLRGDHVAQQPLVDEASGSVLCWNGEAWKIQGQLVQGNDGEAVLSLLTDASRRHDEDHVLNVLRSIEGPFAFIFFDKPSGRLYYGRDRLGRRSLLLHAGGPFVLSSIVEQPTLGWEEVEPDGCYVIQLHRTDTLTDFVRTRLEWIEDTTLVSSIAVFNKSLPKEAPRLCESSPSVEVLLHHLNESVRLRLLNVPIPPQCSSTDARIAVLFSGGLDCTVLARLASDILPPEQSIDLINVAFENPRIASQQKPDLPVDLYELCPDRVTGRKSFAELHRVCPDRRWRFVNVNVPYTATTAHRQQVIRLMHPHNTEMDLSIAYALYFAARGRGHGISSPDSDPESYDTTARVLLSGLGADELFGGYMRHGTAFSYHGFPGLVEELKLDVSRLGKRNLGRDDRVMAHWGREVRFPYLDEGLVKWAIEAPVWEKCDFKHAVSDPDPGPDKKVLRLLAKKLGLESVAKEKKRAIQFGARTAKMESGKVKGTTLISN